MRVVDTYERMENHCKAWKGGEIRFLAIIGAPGLGKSWWYEQNMPAGSYHLFKGRVSAIDMYCALYDAPGWPVVIDDVKSILQDSNSIDLMKALCDTREERWVTWRTATPLLGDRKKEFVASGPVLLVSNRTLTKNDDVAAVIDRADAIAFEPSKREILRKLDTYAQDKEIVQAMRTLPVLPSLRTFDKCVRWKKSKHLKWRDELLGECGVAANVLMALKIIQAHPKWSVAKMAQEFVATTGMSERTFYYAKIKADEIIEAAKDCVSAAATDNEVRKPTLVKAPDQQPKKRRSRRADVSEMDLFDNGTATSIIADGKAR